MLRVVFQTLLIAFVVAVLSPPARAEVARKADRKVEAKLHYDDALKKFDAGKYDEAADDFVAAYEIVGEPAILYNIAQAYRLADRYEKSAQYYRTFLREMGGNVPNRAEIEGRIVEMDERSANQRRQAERRERERREAARKSERRTSLPYTASEDRNAQQAGSDDPERGARPGRGLKIFGYTLCAFTGVALGTGIAMGVLAGQASDQVERAAGAMETFSPALQDTESRGRLYDTLSIVGYSVAGAAAIGGALSIYFGFRAEKMAAYESTTPVSERTRRPPSLSLSVLAPSFSAGTAGLVIGGRF